MRGSKLNLARWLKASLVALLVLAAAGARADEVPARLEHVRLQLKWRHQFQFAGYYVALEKGYYRDAGLDVTIVPAQPGIDPIDKVLSGEAEFGVASSELVLRYARGDPLVVLGVIFQHSPLTLFARRAAGIEHVHDLVGKRVALAPSETEVFAYLHREQIPVAKLRLVQHDFSVKSLIDGSVDVLAGYDTDESYELEGEREQYARFSPRSSGVDFYGDTLFTSRAQVRSDPKRVEAFRAASLRGWEYVFAHVDEVAALIHDKYAPGLPVDKLRFEAAHMLPFIQPDLVEVGYSHVGRWRHILDVYQELGIVPPGRTADLGQLLYRPEPQALHGWLIWVILGSGVVVAGIGWVAVRFYRLSQGLRGQLEANQLLQEQLRELAMSDPLTGLHNRRALTVSLDRELSRAQRESAPVSVALIDIDNFKELNDTYGHAVGDEVLRRMGDLLQASCRGSDIACRYGGEEFVVVMPNVSAETLAARVQTWLAAFSAAPVDGRGDFPVTFSAGVASFPQHGAVQDRLLQAADAALYTAKHSGRNRICVAGEATSGRTADPSTACGVDSAG